jgi:hypothetical protein
VLATVGTAGRERKGMLKLGVKPLDSLLGCKSRRTRVNDLGRGKRAALAHRGVVFLRYTA